MTATNSFTLEPLPRSTFGALVRFDFADGVQTAVETAQIDAQALPRALHQAGGLLVVPGMQALAEQPELLVRLSRLFGTEVENYHQTLTETKRVHDSVAEILLVSNLPPCNQPPPAQPDPPLTVDGVLPTQFPHRRGWHTDQSFRRPPPDISLFYAVIPSPKGQGQTLYATGTVAYEALPPALKARVRDLKGIHVMPGTGRSEPAVKEGQEPIPLLPHQEPQHQPVVRVHPVTGKPALYLCEAGQMDWITGPFADMPPGPDGEGAKLLYELMAHITQPRFTYTHDWERGDLVIYDNRNVLHAATWFDSDRYPRLMWRTTVMGHPGEEYAGEAKSWIPA